MVLLPIRAMGYPGGITGKDPSVEYVGGYPRDEVYTTEDIEAMDPQTAAQINYYYRRRLKNLGRQIGNSEGTEFSSTEVAKMVNLYNSDDKLIVKRALPQFLQADDDVDMKKKSEEMLRRIYEGSAQQAMPIPQVEPTPQTDEVMAEALRQAAPQQEPVQPQDPLKQYMDLRQSIKGY